MVLHGKKVVFPCFPCFSSFFLILLLLKAGYAKVNALMPGRFVSWENGSEDVFCFVFLFFFAWFCFLGDRLKRGFL